MPVIFAIQEIRVTFLALKDTSSIEESIAQNRIKALTTIVLQGQANELVYTTNQENQRMQTRVFYMAILAGLFSAIFIGQKKIINGNAIAYSAIIVMLTMYYFDVRMADQTKQQRIPNLQRFQNTVDTLVQVDKNVHQWYTLDPSRNKEPNDTFFTGLYRRMNLFFLPSIDQVLYYFIPLILLLAMSLFKKEERRRRLTSRSS